MMVKYPKECVSQKNPILIVVNMECENQVVKIICLGGEILWQ